MLSRPNKDTNQEYFLKLADLSAEAVYSYEKYLLDEIDYKKLAKIMKELRDHLEKRNLFY
jgi:hypothetical protein